MTRSNAAYFGMGAVAGASVTALFFLFKEGLLFVGDNVPIVRNEHSVVSALHEGEAFEEKPIPYKDVQADNISEVVAYHNILNNAQYKPTDAERDNKVFVISDEEYFEAGRDGSYDMQALTLYSDGILADASSDRILDATDRMSILGTVFDAESLLKTFVDGVDIIYIRNERLHTQYEINYDDRTYEEVTGQVSYG